MASVSAPAFASDQGFEVKPVKQVKTSKKTVSSAKFVGFDKKPHKKDTSFKVAKFDKQSKKEAKYLAIAAVGAIGYALLSEYEKDRD
jgi:hypothetical protein